MKAGLDGSRKIEWDKWKQFHAGRPCRGKELKDLLDAGHVPIPTRWVDRYRNEFNRRACNPDNVPLDLKSRLVGRGDLETLDGVRTDSPTMDSEGHNLIFSFAASKGLRIKSADISNAYFQG